MSRRVLILLVLMFLAAIPLYSFDYFGSWSNDDPATRGVLRFSIRMEAGQPMLFMQGSCHPKPCEMPATPLQLYASAVDKPSDIRAAGAVMRTTFSETLFVLTPEGNDHLRVSAYERFTDQSGRSAFTWSETFSRR